MTTANFQTMTPKELAVGCGWTLHTTYPQSGFVGVEARGKLPGRNSETRISIPEMFAISEDDAEETILGRNGDKIAAGLLAIAEVAGGLRSWDAPGIAADWLEEQGFEAALAALIRERI